MKARVVHAFKELPPVRALRRARFERKFRKPARVALHRGIYRSFAEAVADAPPTMPTSYDTGDAAEMYKERLTRVYPSDYPVLFWLGAIWDGVRSVFDFGGHVGIAFYAYEKYLRYPAALRWTVLDVPAVVAKGRAMASSRGEARLAFTESLADAEGADVFLAAGSLQFVERPLHAMIAGLARKPRHVLVNRSPMLDDDAFVTLHNNGAAICPYNVFSQRAMTDAMQGLGYELVDAWKNYEPGVSCIVALHPEKSVEHYTGMYFRRRDDAG